MRVLTTTDTIGGVWTFTQDLSLGLLHAGCSVALVSLGGLPKPSQREWCDSLRDTHGGRFRYDALDLPLEWMQENDQAYCAAEPELLRIAEEFGAELVHSNQFCFGALPLRLPKLITAHSDVLSWAEACRGGALPDSRWLATYRDLVESGLGAAAAIVAPTRWMLDALARHFRLPLEQAVIFNGRSVASSKAVARALQSITVGRIWDEGKDIGLLREVTSPIPMLVAGESERYGSRPAESEWGDIKFLGALSQRQVLDIFRRSAIYICTSVYEPFGLAPLEAALCGCAVLARDLPSLREVWGDHALYFRDAPSLSQLLHQLHDDSHLLRERQRQSAARASFFSAERMAHAYLALYRRLCAQPTAASDAA